MRGRKGQHKDVLATIRKAGFVRARVDGEVVDVDQVAELAPRKNHTIEAVVDRVVVREGVAPRLAESINLALTHGEGGRGVHVEPYGNGASGSNGKPRRRTAPMRQLTRPALQHAICLPQLQDQLRGTGAADVQLQQPLRGVPDVRRAGGREQFDPELVIPDDSLSLAAGAVAPWKGATPRRSAPPPHAVTAVPAAAGFDWKTPLDEAQAASSRTTACTATAGRSSACSTLLEHEYATTPSRPAARTARSVSRRGALRSAAARGSARGPQRAASRQGDPRSHGADASSQARALFRSGSKLAAKDERRSAQPIVQRDRRGSNFWTRSGVDYLTLDRPADTLSGGELQRVRLATGIGSGLVGVCYVLDEPSIGLHPRDNQRLIDALRDLQQQGNTVLVVEHDEAIMRRPTG